jgi:alpha-L-fucosidase 2
MFNTGGRTMFLISMTQAVLAISVLAPAGAGLPRPEHGLSFDTPVSVWDEALPLGNGNLGALVWGDGHPLRISLDRTDLWDLRPVPEFHTEEYSYAKMREWEKVGKVDDLLRVYDNPYNRPAPTRIPAGRIEMEMGDGAAFSRTEISLADATANVAFADGREVRVWIHGEQAVGVITMPAPGPDAIRLAAPEFGGKPEGPAKPAIVAGEVSQLGYPPPATSSGETWTAYEQEGWGGFRFSVYLGWRVSGDAWTGAWSIASTAEGPDPLARAKQRVEAVLEGDAAAFRAAHEAWWKHYWGRSWVAVPNPVIERQWYLETYKFGAASRRGHPPITLQGPWTADDGKLPPWKGDYHHDLNTELCYWPCYSGNRLDEGLAFLDWLWASRDNCKEWTQRFFGMPGMNVPMTADLNNNQIGGWRQYTHSSTTGAWLAHHFYLHWRYSRDPQFLAERAYPYLRDCAVFIEAVTSERDAAGLRTLPLSSSPEINDNRPNAWFPSITNYDLALVRWLMQATAELAEAAGQADDAKHWREVLSEMPELSRGDDGGLLVAKDYPLPASHRHFSHLMAIHPLGLLDVDQGEAAEKSIQASLAELDRLGSGAWCGYSFAWLTSLAARARDGARAEKALDIFSTAFTLRNSFHCNGDQSGKGYSTFTYRPFTLEGNFAAAAGLQEMLLQSHTGVIEVFPAVPESWQDAAFHTLRAEGAFLVSAEHQQGKTVRVEITAERGGPCRLRSPFSGKVLDLATKPDQTLVLTSDPVPQP